jgi:hypothetical protein
MYSEYEDAFREGVGEIPDDSKGLAGLGQRLLIIQSLATLTFIANML